MFCKECGTKIPDEAQFCPYCGEVLEIPKEMHSLDNKLEGDFNFYLDWVTEADILSQGMRTNIYVQVAKITSAPVYGAKVQLSGPPEVNIVVSTRKIHPKKSTNKLSFPISAEEPGLFTLTATLTSDAGHRIAFPFKIRVKPTKNLYRKEIPADGTPATAATYNAPTPTTSQDLTGARIIFGIIGVILLFAGGATSVYGGFGSGLPFGITLIVIGVIILGVVTNGCCCYAGAGCGDCDCGDCGDCDCDC